MIYWIILFGIIILNLKFKKETSLYLWIGFYLFLASSVVSVFGIFNLSEISFRICLIFLLTGFAFSARDYLTGGGLED